MTAEHALARAALHDHGKVIAGVDGRIDVVTARSQAAKRGAPDAVITRCYREGDERDRITLHATPEVLETLRELCDRILGPKAGSSRAREARDRSGPSSRS